MASEEMVKAEAAWADIRAVQANAEAERISLESDRAALAADRERLDAEATAFRSGLAAEMDWAAEAREALDREARSRIDAERSELARGQAEVEARFSEAILDRRANEEASRRLADRAKAMLEQEDGMAKREVRGTECFVIFNSSLVLRHLLVHLCVKLQLHSSWRCTLY